MSKKFNFPSITFPEEKINYITPSWEDLNLLAFRVAQKILQNNQKFDRIITLAKGGWPMTRSMVDFLQVEKVASIGVKFYSGINQRLDQPQIYQDLPVSVAGEEVLLFDDVADTGESLIFVKKHLLDLGVKNIKTASLFYKPHSKIKPDYYGAETKAWIIFPYDTVDMIKLLTGKWRKFGLDNSEIKSRLKRLNFASQFVNYYFKD